MPFATGRDALPRDPASHVQKKVQMEKQEKPLRKEPQLRERKSAFAEAAKRSVEAMQRLPAPDARERIYRRRRRDHKDLCISLFSRWPKPINLSYDKLIFLFN